MLEKYIRRGISGGLDLTVAGVRMYHMYKKFFLVVLLLLYLSTISACEVQPNIPLQEERWGIYTLDLNTQETTLLYSADMEISKFDLNPAGDTIAFSQVVGDTSEIFTLDLEHGPAKRLTENDYLDTYPAWSPDGAQIAYLSFSEETLDIHIMASDGGQPAKLYDSGFHDADIDWTGDRIAFTREHQIWIMRPDGTQAVRVTDPPHAGEWGNANLPFGDYDPRISPDGTTIVFERMVDVGSPHGNYDLFKIDIDGSNLTRLTNNGYSQGLASWSPSGSQIAYLVSAIDGIGQYDLYLIDADGANNRNITPDVFPDNFLVQWVSFANTDSLVYFIGEWWQE